MYSTDNGSESFSWPDGGTTMFRREKTTQWEGGYRDLTRLPPKAAVDRHVERLNSAIAGRADLLAGRKSLTVFPGMMGMIENAFVNVKGVHQTHHRRGGD